MKMMKEIIPIVGRNIAQYGKNMSIDVPPATVLRSYGTSGGRCIQTMPLGELNLARRGVAFL